MSKIYHFNIMPCYFCQKNVNEIDHQNTIILKKFISGLAKIKARKKSGLCSKHQRKLARAVKRSRVLGLLPYTTK